ncbi:MAG: hypothetical protein MJ172_10930 [Clostridia bacterium]|nr:hypothetical protein [Clostridia bacterium]
MENSYKTKRYNLTFYSMIVEIFNSILFGAVILKIFYAKIVTTAFNAFPHCCFGGCHHTKFSGPKFWTYEVDMILGSKGYSLDRVRSGDLNSLIGMFLFISLLALISFLISKHYLNRAKWVVDSFKKDAVIKIVINSLSLCIIIAMMTEYPTFLFIVFMLPLIFAIVLAIRVLLNKDSLVGEFTKEKNLVLE